MNLKGIQYRVLEWDFSHQSIPGRGRWQHRTIGENDLSCKTVPCLNQLLVFDGLYIHIKGPDEPGHDGDYNAKKDNIEAIDKYFFTPLLSRIDLKDVIIAVTADHSTPCSLKAHSADPVPLLVCGSSIEPDGGMGFSEKSARLGSLGEILGRELLGKLVAFSRQ